jgi:hypothetical protein
MMLLLAVGVALMVMLAVIFASKKAIAENY